MSQLPVYASTPYAINGRCLKDEIVSNCVMNYNVFMFYVHNRLIISPPIITMIQWRILIPVTMLVERRKIVLIGCWDPYLLFPVKHMT